jgi:hypothetical protein
MDDMTRFERDLADELHDMAGPGRDIDGLAMTRAASAHPARWRLRSMFSATRMVLVASLASVVLALLVIGRAPTVPEQQVVPGAASASPSAPASVLPGLVTEEVEPGVLRIIRDDAGHDLDEGHPDFRYDLDGMTITPDGTVWLNTSYHDSDNGAGVPLGPLVWALGRPGVLGTADGIPQSLWSLVPLPDSSILAVGDEIVRVDGTRVSRDDGQRVRPVYGGSLWLIEPDVPVELSAGDRPDRRLEMIWDGATWTSLSEVGRSVSSPSDWCEATYQGIACLGDQYLRGTIINQLAVAPDGAIWAVGALGDQGGGLYRISPR